VSDGEREQPRSIGRYVLFDEVARGGMATVHLGRLRGQVGFTRAVAIKRLHPQFVRDPEFVSMFLDEARLAARIRHPNVVSVLDVVAAEGELFLVMDYIHGESLAQLIRLAGKQGKGIPRRVLISIFIGLLLGLDAAHEARSERGEPLGIVHRDVSPQNVLLGLDGVPRILELGVAKAALHAQGSSEAGQLKRKLAYMSPEQLTTGLVDRRTDVYAVGVMLWEGLTGRRLYDPKATRDGEAAIARILSSVVVPPSRLVTSTPKELDAIVWKALSRSTAERYATAREMAAALEAVVPMTPARQIGEWVREVAGKGLDARAIKVSEIERFELPARTTPSEQSALGGELLVREPIGPEVKDSEAPPQFSHEPLPPGLDLAALRASPTPSVIPIWETIPPGPDSMSPPPLKETSAAPDAAPPAVEPAAKSPAVESGGNPAEAAAPAPSSATPLHAPTGLDPAPTSGTTQAAPTPYASARNTHASLSSLPVIPVPAPKRLVWASGAALSFLILIVTWAMWPRSANGNRDTRSTPTDTSGAANAPALAGNPETLPANSAPPIPESPPPSQSTEDTAAPPPPAATEPPRWTAGQSVK
jgi:eukaryotic-like serine/threonine-protein kinase